MARNNLTMMVFEFLVTFFSVASITKMIRNLHGTSDTFDINLACALVDRNTVHFDTKVLASFVECCMGR